MFIRLQVKLLIASIIVLSVPGLLNATEWNASTDRTPNLSRFAREYGKTPPPIGWVKFCKRHKRDCSSDGARRSRVRLTDEAWSQMVRVNVYVNSKVEPVTDQELYNVAEHWTYPGNRGDCEDYVLLKRLYLINMGWPRESLLVTVVLNDDNTGHALLTVVTDIGEFVLDNQNPEILPWHVTRYIFIKRQSQRDPRLWVSLQPEAQHQRRTILGKTDG